MKLACGLITHLRAKAEMQRRPHLQGQPVVIVDRGKSGAVVVDHFPAAAAVPAGMPDFIAYEKMAGEYEVMDLNPQGHPLEFVCPQLSRGVLPSAADWRRARGRRWPTGPSPASTPRVGSAHCSSPSRMSRATCSSSSGPGSVQRRRLQSNIVLASGAVSRRDGAATLVVSDLRATIPAYPCPPPATGAE